MVRRRSVALVVALLVLLALIDGHPAAARIATTSVNDQSTDAGGYGDQQSGASIAVLPSKPVVAWFDSGGFSGGKTVGYARSTDNGNAFTDEGSLPDTSHEEDGEPVLAADQGRGAVLLSVPAFDQINVARSTDGGATFGAPVDGTPGTAGTTQWLTVDDAAGTGTGNAYLCFTSGSGASRTVRLTRSTNGGASFTPNLGLLVSHGGTGCSVVTGPDHSVYVAYLRGTGTGGDGGDNRLFIRRSTDRGVSFGAEHEVADLASTSSDGRLTLEGEHSGLPYPRITSFPVAAVNPVDGTVYVAWNDLVGSDRSDVFSARSNDGGTSWTGPTQVNDDDGGLAQYQPSIAVSPSGTRLMIGYASRSFDPVDLLTHHRGRIAVVDTATHAVAFRPSFQMGPSTPIVIEDTTVLGRQHDQIATDAAGRFHAVWSDFADASGTDRHQPDIRYARIDSDLSTVGLSVSAAAPGSASVGDTVALTMTVANSGPGAADDVALNDRLPDGLVPLSAAPGSCHIEGQQASCLVGTIGAGQQKVVTITALAARPGTFDDAVQVTTSDKDTSGANAATASVEVDGATTTVAASTGSIAVAIPAIPFQATDVPIQVPAGGRVLGVRARVRLDFPFDASLDLSLISPDGRVVELARDVGGSGADVGSGANSCAGTPAQYRDDAAASVFDGSAPFAGAYRPENYLSRFVEAPSGPWKLRVVNDSGDGGGTVGCVQLDIVRPK